MMCTKNVLMFGATSAIAQATARLLVQQGCGLYAVGRNPQKLHALIDDLRVRAAPGQRIEGMVGDLDDLAQHASLFDAAWQTLQGIDTVFIAHGTLPDQSACETSVALTLAQIHTNALSAIALAAEAATRLQAQGAGMIVAIGSVAGDRGRQSNYAYGASKGMLALYLQGLRNRLAPKGVHVLTIKPGFVDTPMTAAFDKKGLLWATPEQVAKGITRAMRKQRDVVYLPWFWRWIMLVIRSIPERVFKRLTL